MELFAFLIAVVALVAAFRAVGRAKSLALRIDALEAALRRQRSPMTPVDFVRQRPPPIESIPEAALAEEFLAPEFSDEPTAPPRSSPPPIPTAPAPVESPVFEPIKPPVLSYAPPKPGLEEQLGTRWVIWIGGLTLALGGLFLVRYSITIGLLGPKVRVALGALFALALLIVGEFTRRRDRRMNNLLAGTPSPSPGMPGEGRVGAEQPSSNHSQAPPPAPTPSPTLPRSTGRGGIAETSIADIPSILTAAGTCVAFGTVYAAYSLYHFLSPSAAFVLLGLVALGTMAAALLHGPALAGLGVMGAFFTPMLVSTGQPAYWPLYVYLTIATAAAFGLARLRGWRWLAVAAIVAGVLWSFYGIDRVDAFWPHAFMRAAGFGLSAWLIVEGFMLGAPTGRFEPLSSFAPAAYLFAAALLALAQGHSEPATLLFAALTAATAAVAWRAESAVGAVPIAAVALLSVFAAWAVRSDPWLSAQAIDLAFDAPALSEGGVRLHLIVGALFGVGFALAGFFAQGRSQRAITPVLWSGVGVFTPIALLIVLYARLAHWDRSFPFALVAFALAVAFAAATEILIRRAARPGLLISAAFFTTGSLAALALAFSFSLEKGWLTIALALISLGAAWVAMKRPIPLLRWLAAILAGVVAARVGYDPRIVGADVGVTPIFNWLLLGYGIPAAAFWLASVFLRRRRDDAPLRMIESAAVLFTVLLVFMETRHFIHHGDVYHPSVSLTETALHVCTALAMAIGFERLVMRTRSIIHDAAATLLTAAALITILIGLLVWQNPLFHAIDVGGPFINLLLLAYALPAILCLLLAFAAAAHRPAGHGNVLAGAAFLLALTYLTLEIRRLFHGPILADQPTGDTEQYTYSVAWLAFGVLLLTAGLLTRSQRARTASAVMIGLTLLKAFLIDTDKLTGAYRGFSFIGLGLVLVAIGWFYQRVVFRRKEPAAGQA